MLMANLNSNFNDTWLAKIPAPQFNYPNNIREALDASEGTIYLHASYWSYVTTSHIGTILECKNIKDKNRCWRCSRNNKWREILLKFCDIRVCDPLCFLIWKLGQYS